jgi:hypothetical protein
LSFVLFYHIRSLLPNVTLSSYYNVSPLLGIVFYKNDAADNHFYNSAYTPTLRWAAPAGTDHSPDGYVGNPSWDSSSLSNATDLHALRAVAEWLP